MLAFLPDLGWPLLQRSCVSSILCQSEVHLGLDERAQGGGMDGPGRISWRAAKAALSRLQFAGATAPASS